MKHHHPIIALLLAACVLGAGCGRRAPSYEESELPYGATMRSDKNSYTIPMSYDRRFVEEPQVKAVADLLGAVQNRDGALYETVSPELCTRYQIEQYEAGDIDGLMEHLHSMLAGQTAEDYALNMVLITDVSTDMDKGGLAQAVILLSGIYGDAWNGGEQIEKAWDMTLELDVSYESGAKFKMIEGQHLYVFQMPDGVYAML